MSERRRIADLLRRFLAGDVGAWELDDFLSTRQDDPVVESHRVKIAWIPETYPAEDGRHYASREGRDRIRAIAEFLDPGGI